MARRLLPPQSGGSRGRAWGSRLPKLSQPSRAAGLRGAACLLHDAGVTAAFISGPRFYSASYGSPPSVQLAWLLVTAFLLVYLFIFLFLTRSGCTSGKRTVWDAGTELKGLSLVRTLAPAKCTQHPAAPHRPPSPLAHRGQPSLVV